jgi:peptidoglycan/LPS O-acetylase OafA/YrhL
MAAVALIQLAVTSPNGDIIGGWSVDPAQLRIGFTRLFYPFFAGLFVSRVAKPGRVKNAFLWCSLLLILVLSFPRVGSVHQLWINGLYDSLSIILLFPLIIYLGASGEIKGELISKTGKFLGDISYPIYIIHYPFIYIFTAWYANHKTFLDSASPNAIISLILAAFLVLAVSIAVAYACVKFYDIPVRKWLTQRFMSHEKT